MAMIKKHPALVEEEDAAKQQEIKPGYAAVLCGREAPRQVIFEYRGVTLDQAMSMWRYDQTNVDLTVLSVCSVG